MLSRAMETIQSEAMRLINVRILSAVEACEWSTVHKLCDQLRELAVLGMHRTSMEKTLPTLKTTCSEREAR